jgi:maltose alpha-D-glucosyltransferase / alpha-amylase
LDHCIPAGDGTGTRTAGVAANRGWHHDAVIYQLHVRTFADSNGDGIGDFPGLTAKLDYLCDLGITCLWLMPFCESPLRDDGYDVSHYERIQPAYGTLGEFQTFLDAAHARGLRVITELVINHTSDQHPWFQAARRAARGSVKRNFYVWSDSPTRYPEARIIFRDVETSNWAWDPVANSYYWHRFFAHQPDLNFDNPHVRQAVLKVMRFWLDKGVDGLRLDAVAHLFERDGTRCENLPETHAFLKEVRASMDARYAGRILLAEVNDAPERLRAYFGDGDECHMAFHFPLMPRLFMGFARETAAPIVDILERTGELPEGCEWALFLRNHDELTLSALEPAERAALQEVYAPEPRMRLNHGIRRRLAPLLGHHDDRLALAYALLLSLPGTPVLYYGDELGMTDDVDLADRDGLRAPMPWLPREGNRISVAAQTSDPGSLLYRIRRLVTARQGQAALREGRTTFLSTGNARILAFVRQTADQQVVVIANLAGSRQEAALDIPGAAATAAYIDLLDSAAPAAHLSAMPYRLTLKAHGCAWLSQAAAPVGVGAASSVVGHSIL